MNAPVTDVNIPTSNIWSEGIANKPVHQELTNSTPQGLLFPLPSMHKSARSPGTRDVGLVRLAGGFGTNLNCEEWVVGKQKGHAQQKHAFLLPTPELKPNTRGVTVVQH